MIFQSQNNFGAANHQCGKVKKWNLSVSFSKCVFGVYKCTHCDVNLDSTSFAGEIGIVVS